MGGPHHARPARDAHGRQSQGRRIMSRIVAFGEIMGRLATPGFKRFAQAMPGPLNVTFAGAEASVAAAMAYLGGEAAFVTALPANAIADACVANLRSMGVDT